MPLCPGQAGDSHIVLIPEGLYTGVQIVDRNGAVGNGSLTLQGGARLKFYTHQRRGKLRVLPVEFKTVPLLIEDNIIAVFQLDRCVALQNGFF